jgi:hypothetical protein
VKIEEEKGKRKYDEKTIKILYHALLLDKKKL